MVATLSIAMVPAIQKPNHLKSEHHGCHFVWISNGYRKNERHFVSISNGFGQNGCHCAQNGTPLENGLPLKYWKVSEHVWFSSTQCTYRNELPCFNLFIAVVKKIIKRTDLNGRAREWKYKFFKDVKLLKIINNINKF